MPCLNVRDLSSITESWTFDAPQSSWPGAVCLHKEHTMNVNFFVDSWDWKSYRSLGVRQATEYAPWSVASGHIIDVYRYLKLRPSQDCATNWANYITTNVMGVTLGNHTELALNASNPEPGQAVPDVQSRLLRPLLASLSTEFNDSGGRMQARSIFQVHFFTLLNHLDFIFELSRQLHDVKYAEYYIGCCSHLVGLEKMPYNTTKVQRYPMTVEANIWPLVGCKPYPGRNAADRKNNIFSRITT